ncbi:hypothetical protein M9Y10_011497 [Tritrichomonas musculus]|uniref:Tetraspanin family protein n=1 Tax=Tritrichomonas musculus TaxID=1915356 RepID=A0ABR2IJH1_9EUKA
MCKSCQADYVPIFICILSIVNLGLLIAEVSYASHWYEQIHPWWGYSTSFETAVIQKYLIIFITFSCVTICGTLIFPRFFAHSSNARTKIRIAEIGSIYIASGLIVCVFGFLICLKTNSHQKCNEIETTLLNEAYAEIGQWTRRRYNMYLLRLRTYPDFYNRFCIEKSLKIERILIAFTAILGIMAFLLVGVPIAYKANEEAFMQP